MLTERELRRRDELWNVVSMNETAGANIEEARGEMNVMLASKDMSIHFRLSGKLRGISGSSCDSHPTMPLSRSDSGRGAGARRAFLLLKVRFVAMRDNLLLVLDFVVTLRISSSSTFSCGTFMEALVWHNC